MATKSGSTLVQVIACCLMAPSYYMDQCWFTTDEARPQFYQTRSAWSMDQGSTKKRSAVHNFVSTVTKFCVMWEGLSLPHDTKFSNCRGAIVDRRVIFIWSLIHGSSWSGLIKVGPGGILWFSGGQYSRNYISFSTKCLNLHIWKYCFISWRSTR